MLSRYILPVFLPVAFGLAGCDSSPPPSTTQVIVQAAQPTLVPMAPSAPPPPMPELVAPPPSSFSSTVWQPGHWRYSGLAGNPWAWEGGRYVAVPVGAHAWVPGVWQQQGGGFVWQEGHWA